MVLPAVLRLGDLGPWPTPAVRAKTIEKTIWAEGIHLVNDVNYLPAEGRPSSRSASSSTPSRRTLQKLERDGLPASPRRRPRSSSSGWTRTRSGSPTRARTGRSNGILCYSKICTHVGCPISLWEQQTHHLLCPCHQSTFDLGNSGVVVFGPAARSLPQLPITTDADGYLVARSDFTVPVGPSFFERDSSKDFKEGDN